MNKVAVVILNWNGRKHLEEFLPSVVRYSFLQGVEVIVADNGSTDDSVVFLKEQYPSINLMLFDKNFGFAGGYNKALAGIEADCFILLNSDVEVTENWIEPLTTLLSDNPDLAACMPKIRSHVRKEYFEYAGASGGYLDRFGYAFCRGRLFDLVEKDEGQYDQTVPVFWATGACLCIKAEVFKQAGGFDERFFAHMEEIDLCWRLQNAGYKIMVNPQSLVYHYGGGALPPDNPFKTYLNFRNNLLMLFKNLNRGALFTILPFRILLDWLSIFKFLAYFRFSHIWSILRAHLSFLGMLPAYMSIRKQSPQKAKLSKLAGVFNGSIVWSFFVRKRQNFSSLNHLKLN
jgi:GT2 family glycosyltransferase